MNSKCQPNISSTLKLLLNSVREKDPGDELRSILDLDQQN